MNWKKIWKYIVTYFDLNKPLLPEPESHSTYALMPNGLMDKDSLGRVMFDNLMKAYNREYVDTNDKEMIFTCISADFQNQVDQAWHAFLAEIKFDE